MAVMNMKMMSITSITSPSGHIDNPTPEEDFCCSIDYFSIQLARAAEAAAPKARAQFNSPRNGDSIFWRWSAATFQEVVISSNWSYHLDVKDSILPVKG